MGLTVGFTLLSVYWLRPPASAQRPSGPSTGWTKRTVSVSLWGNGRRVEMRWSCLPSPPCKCTEAYKQPDPLFTRYRQKKEWRLLYQKPRLTRQNVWVMPFMTPQILRGFLHMYTLNSCHFFLYLLWIFKKCYQSTCFTILFTVFLYFPEGLRSLGSSWSSLGGLRPVWADSGDVWYLYSV